MRTVLINTRVPSYREYKRLKWDLRESKKFEMEEATRRAFSLEPRLASTGDQLVIEIGGRGYPENYMITPILGVLRANGWINQECAIIIRTSEKVNGATVSI